ncbi:hypothetical protein Tco_0352176 [Tanacetum coccineum]
MHIMHGDGVAGMKRRCRDLYGDDVSNFVTALGRGRLKEDLESSMWRRHEDGDDVLLDVNKNDSIVADISGKGRDEYYQTGSLPSLDCEVKIGGRGGSCEVVACCGGGFSVAWSRDQSYDEGYGYLKGGSGNRCGNEISLLYVVEAVLSREGKRGSVYGGISLRVQEFVFGGFRIGIGICGRCRGGSSSLDLGSIHLSWSFEGEVSGMYRVLLRLGRWEYRDPLLALAFCYFREVHKKHYGYNLRRDFHLSVLAGCDGSGVNWVEGVGCIVGARCSWLRGSGLTGLRGGVTPVGGCDYSGITWFTASWQVKVESLHGYSHKEDPPKVVDAGFWPLKLPASIGLGVGACHSLAPYCGDLPMSLGFNQEGNEEALLRVKQTGAGRLAVVLRVRRDPGAPEIVCIRALGVSGYFDADDSGYYCCRAWIVLIYHIWITRFSGKVLIIIRAKASCKRVSRMELEGGYAQSLLGRSCTGSTRVCCAVGADGRIVAVAGGGRGVQAGLRAEDWRSTGGRGPVGERDRASSRGFRYKEGGLVDAGRTSIGEGYMDTRFTAAGVVLLGHLHPLAAQLWHGASLYIDSASCVFDSWVMSSQRLRSGVDFFIPGLDTRLCSAQILTSASLVTEGASVVLLAPVGGRGLACICFLLDS